jgi:hypothetical protein
MLKFHRVAVCVALIVITGSVLGRAPGSGAAPTAHATFDFTNPARNLAGPRYALSSGECTGRGAGGFIDTHCSSPCYPSYVVRPNGSTEFPLSNSVACTTYTLAAVNVAQAHEHARTIVLPTNYYHLTVPEQLFVLTDLERVTRGLPPLVGLVPSLNQAASQGARDDRDPVMASAHYVANDNAWVSGPIVIAAHFEGGTSIWAGDDSSPVDAMFEWMYDDGWGGSTKSTSNLACSSPTGAGCWGHRDNLLGASFGSRCATCVAGAAYAGSNAENAWTTSYAMIFVEPVNQLVMTFTWNRNVVPYLTTSYERVTAS